MSAPDHPHRFRPPDRSSPVDGADGTGFLFAEVVGQLPEFVPRYRRLVEAVDDDPGEPTVLMELAAFVADRLATVETEESALSRALRLVEALLGARADDALGVELIGYAFFDAFTIEDRHRLAGRLGPCSLQALESLERSDGETRG